MKTKFFKVQNVIIAKILTILGFSAYSISCAPVAEYGTPSATFIITGNVSSKQTKQAVENIHIIGRDANVLTNNKGDYKISATDFPDDQKFLIQFRDSSGGYKDFDTLVEFENPVFKGGDNHWYDGETSKTVNVELSPKENN